jgi:hypothetical protein
MRKEDTTMHVTVPSDSSETPYEVSDQDIFRFPLPRTKEDDAG